MQYPGNAPKQLHEIIGKATNEFLETMEGSILVLSVGIRCDHWNCLHGKLD